MSEYRRELFEDHGIAAKPVVLMKSQRIADSNAFYEEFFARLNALTPGEILSLSGSEMIDPVLDYFRGQDATLQSLVEALRDEFSRERSLIMNGSKDNSTQTQLQVNSLEDPANPIRIVFTVDMLNEGWDALTCTTLFASTNPSGWQGRKAWPVHDQGSTAHRTRRTLLPVRHH